MEKSKNPFKRSERKRSSMVEKAVEKLSVSDVSAHQDVERPAREAAPRVDSVLKSESVTAPVLETADVAQSNGMDSAPVAPPPLPSADAVEARDGGYPHDAPEAETAHASGKRVKLDLERMRSVGMVTSHSERTLIAEEFRLVKRPLLLKAFAKGPEAVERGNLIMVASSRPGEGKTFCSISLAMSIASERDLTVLLIDADIAKPDIPNSMGFDAGKGLVDVLADSTMDLSDVMLKTDLDNLTIVPAGTSHHLATELLASDRMAALVEDIAKRYPDRIIILDSPPVLMSSIAGVLALHVGQVLFVVEADRTTEAALDNALGLVSACKNISLLLNKSRSSGGTERFGSYNYGNYAF